MNTSGIKAHVEEGKYAIAIIGKVPDDFFAVIKQKDEISVVVKEEQIEELEIEEYEKNYKIITFDVTFNFSNPAVGFFAKITTALAAKKISILGYSSYYTDHILVKEKDLEKAKEALRKIGIVIEWAF